MSEATSTTDAPRRIIHPPKCRGCGTPVGERGTRSARGRDLPAGIVRRGGRLFHEGCLPLGTHPHRHRFCGCSVCDGACVVCGEVGR